LCSRRRNAPSVPASLQRSASASNRRFSLPENWRRLAIATTSGSRRAPSPEATSPVALPAPSATASEEEPDNPFREDFTNEVMFMSTCTLNCPRQVSHLTLARGGPGHDRGDRCWRGEDERRKKTDVPLPFAFALSDLGERLNAARYEIVDPGPCLCNGEE